MRQIETTTIDVLEYGLDPRTRLDAPCRTFHGFESRADADDFVTRMVRDGVTRMAVIETRTTEFLAIKEED